MEGKKTRFIQVYTFNIIKFIFPWMGNHFVCFWDFYIFLIACVSNICGDSLKLEKSANWQPEANSACNVIVVWTSKWVLKICFLGDPTHSCCLNLYPLITFHAFDFQCPYVTRGRENQGGKGNYTFCRTAAIYPISCVNQETQVWLEIIFTAKYVHLATLPRNGTSQK